MTGEEFRARLAALDWDMTSLAGHLGIQRSSVQRWCSGVYDVPEHVAAWVDELAKLTEAGDAAGHDRLLNQLPKGWEGRPNVRVRDR